MSGTLALQQTAQAEILESASPQIESSITARRQQAEKGTVPAAAKTYLDKLALEESLKLVQNIFLLQATADRVVLFAGVDSRSGCSRICACAAEILACNVSSSVCLVDANFRSPSLSESFRTPNQHGLTDALRGDGPIREFTTPLHSHNLWLLSCGPAAEKSIGLLSSEKMKTRISDLRNEFDYVLIDSPPLNIYTDGLSLGKLSDGLVLVLEAHSTRREVALRVTEDLRTAQVKILGAVLNKRTFPIPQSIYQKL